MLSKEEYIKKELDKLNLKPSINEIVLETIDFPMSITQLNELIEKYRKTYTDDEIEIAPGYDSYSVLVIKIRVYKKESEDSFNIRVNNIRHRIEMDYDRMIKALEA